jgi:hypothetical protein
MNSSFPISFSYSVSTTDFIQRSMRREGNDELCACRNLEGGSHCLLEGTVLFTRTGKGKNISDYSMSRVKPGSSTTQIYEHYHKANMLSAPNRSPHTLEVGA